MTAVRERVPRAVARGPGGNAAAASTIVALPLVVLVLLCQRWIVRGIVAGALKG